MNAFTETAKVDPILATMLQRLGSVHRENSGPHSPGKTAALGTLQEIRKAMMAIRSEARPA